MAKQEKDKKNQKHFWKDFKAELKKVIWPTKKQLANNTLVVIAMVLVTTVIVLLLDLAFEALNTYGINKLKGAVQDSISATTEEESTGEENSEEDNSTEGENQETENTETSTENNNEEQNKTTEQE